MCKTCTMMPKPRTRLVAPEASLWRTGQTIDIGFWDVSYDARFEIIEIATEWTQYADLTFNWLTDGNAPDGTPVVIDTQQKGSWSYVGTDCLLIDGITMNFGWWYDSDEDEKRRVCLHEFGHMLGLAHEHQNPKGGIKWNERAVKDYYRKAPNFWTPEQTETNIFGKYSLDHTIASELDPDSIMMYPIPPEFTLDGYSVGWNHELSEQDKEWIGLLYPAE